MNIKNRIAGGEIVTKIVRDSLDKHKKHYKTIDWLPGLDKEPGSINFGSFLLVVDLENEKMDLGFSKYDLEGLSTDKNIFEDTEKYVDKLVSEL